MVIQLPVPYRAALGPLHCVLYFTVSAAPTAANFHLFPGVYDCVCVCVSKETSIAMQVPGCTHISHVSWTSGDAFELSHVVAELNQDILNKLCPNHPPPPPPPPSTFTL